MGVLPTHKRVHHIHIVLSSQNEASDPLELSIVGHHVGAWKELGSSAGAASPLSHWAVSSSVFILGQ